MTVFEKLHFAQTQFLSVTITGAEATLLVGALGDHLDQAESAHAKWKELLNEDDRPTTDSEAGIPTGDHQEVVD